MLLVCVGLGIVDRAIYLDDQTNFVAIKIRDQAADALLTAEMEAVEFVCAQMLPERRLCGCYLPPKLLRPLLFLRILPAHDNLDLGRVHGGCLSDLPTLQSLPEAARGALVGRSRYDAEYPDMRIESPLPDTGRGQG